MGAISVQNPVHRLWTRAEFNIAAEAGVFAPEERLELIDGEVYVQMSPQRASHSSVIMLAQEALSSWAASHDASLRIQSPLALGDSAQPEPDLAVVRGSARDYGAAHPVPADVLLVVEVSDSTFLFDQTVKGLAYAKARISEYWIVNLQERMLEVRTEPDASIGYKAMRRASVGDRVTAGFAAGFEIEVTDLLPEF